MGDNVDFPVAPSTAKVATDEVDLRGDAVPVQVPIGKIADGADGGTERLVVTDHRGIHSEQSFHGLFGTTAIGQTSYADKECIGGAFQIGTVGGGCYRLHLAELVLIDSGTGDYATDPMPSFALGLVAVPSGSDVGTLFPDGADLNTLTAQQGGAFRWIESTDWKDSFLHGDQSKVCDIQHSIIAQGTGGTSYSEESDVWAIVAADGPVATDLTAWSILVLGAMTFVGDSSRT